VKPRLTADVEKILQARYWSTRAQRDRRLEETYDAHPELQAIDREWTAAGFRLLTDAVNNEAYSDQRLKDIEAKRERYLEAHQLRGDYAEVIPFCRHCGDTGQIEGVLCFCAERLYKSLQPRLFDAALSPDETFEAIDLSLFSEERGDGPSPREHMSVVFSRAAEYVEHFWQLIDRDVIFTGPQGRGKTFLLNAIGNALEAKGIDVTFLPATELFSSLVEFKKLKESFRPDPEQLETATFKKRLIYESTVLLIDDLGLEPLTTQTFADFIDLLNVRQREKRHTLIATNQSFSDFEKNYDKRIASRLAAFTIYQVKGDDLRMKQRSAP